MTTTAPRTEHDYRFTRFTTGLLLEDMRFRPEDPGPGDPAPPFDLPTLDGGRVRSDDLGDRPVLLVFGSRTCPVTRSGAPRLADLHARLGDRVRFVLVQTREAHPGDLLPQPSSAEAKTEHALAMREDLGVRFEVAVDDVDGTLHRAFGPKPNSAYVLTPQGRIHARIQWANDDRAVERALEGVLTGRGTRPRGRTVLPLLRAVGHLPAVVERAGGQAGRDVWRAAPPLALMARLSRFAPRLSPDARGLLVAPVVGAAVLSAGALLARAVI